MKERDKGPRSDWARYAYGYSDKKPGPFFWLILGIMTGLAIRKAFVLFQLVNIQ